MGLCIGGVGQAAVLCRATQGTLVFLWASQSRACCCVYLCLLRRRNAGQLLWDASRSEAGSGLPNESAASDMPWSARQNRRDINPIPSLFSKGLFPFVYWHVLVTGAGGERGRTLLLVWSRACSWNEGHVVAGSTLTTELACREAVGQLCGCPGAHVHAMVCRVHLCPLCVPRVRSWTYVSTRPGWLAEV